jgi:TPR repeat protein
MIIRAGIVACISLMFASVAAFAEDDLRTDCDTYAASDVDPERKAEGVPLDKVEPAKAIPACLEALSQHPNSARFQFQLGRAYAQSGDHQQAASWYQKAAETGFALAQNNLATMYMKGLGVPKDEAKAFAWFRKAAERGIVQAQSNVGISYEFGNGVAKDAVQAAIWYRKAAERGFAQAEFNLGVMYLNGVGVPKNDLEAFSWTRKAAEQGHAKAQFNLGRMYEDAVGVTTDKAQAFNWICKAAEQGSPDAQADLGRRYLKGIGVQENEIVAYKWLNLSAAQGERAAAIMRDTLSKNMTSAQIAEAQRLSREWIASTKPECERKSDATTVAKADRCTIPTNNEVAARTARCFLRVDGKLIIKDRCNFNVSPDGRATVFVAGKYHAEVMVTLDHHGSPSIVTAKWNEGSGRNAPLTSLGSVIESNKDGICFRNRRVEMCASEFLTCKCGPDEYYGCLPD